MLSLVAYGSSGESDDDSDGQTDNFSVAQSTPSIDDSFVKSSVQKRDIDDVTLPSKSVCNSGEVGLNKSSLHSKLPSPKKLYDVEEKGSEASTSIGLLSKLPVPKQHSASSLNFLLKEEKVGLRKGPVKISIPALSDFPDDDDEPKPKKKIQPSSTGSGLFALLPPPQKTSLEKANKLLVPNAISRNLKPSVPLKKPLKTIPKVAAKKKDSDPESDGESEDADFFSLNKEDDIPPAPIDVPPTANTEFPKAALIPEGPLYQQNYQHEELYQLANNQFVSDAPAEELPNSDQDFIPCTVQNLELDEEALRQLCGRQGKRRREEVQIVDVSGDAIMPDQREWLTKQLTEEQPRPSSSKSKLFGPSSQQRRKHQITYLAHVAKENELELKNSWANNRQTRKQTQSKYGF